MLKKIFHTFLIGLKHGWSVYLFLSLLLVYGVDWEAIKAKRLRYLLSNYNDTGFTNALDGILYHDHLARINPRDPQARAALGLGYYQLGRKAEARNEFQIALALGGDLTKMGNEVATAYRHVLPSAAQSVKNAK